LIGRGRHLSIFNVQSFREADCVTDHCLVVAKDRKRLALSKQSSTELRFNLRKLSELEVRKQYHVKTSKSFASLGN
jgi:hypothetical protein